MSKNNLQVTKTVTDSLGWRKYDNLHATGSGVRGVEDTVSSLVKLESKCLLWLLGERRLDE